MQIVKDLNDKIPKHKSNNELNDVNLFPPTWL